jgi:hypothetical protein
MVTTLGALFASVFDRELLLAKARELGALQRLREIHPADVTRALVECALGDEERSIATARRTFGRISGSMPEESAFYNRLNGGLAALMKYLFGAMLAASSRVQRECLARVLGGAGLVELLAVDASQVALPSWAATRFPSTSKARGGVKLTALLSVLHQTLTKVVLTDARKHDRRALKLPRWLHGALILMDRGYCDRKLFASIEQRGGFFLTRLKKSHRPTITKIHSGLDPQHLGKPVAPDLPFKGNVDLEAEFLMPRGERRTYRVVRLVVAANARRGGGENVVELLFVTNLRRDQFCAEQLGTLYRLRWEIERLFLVLKSVGRLDQLRSANPHVIEAFLYATLLGVLLAMHVCALMRKARPYFEPSLHRVAMLLLGYLPALVSTIGTDAHLATVREFERALWREGINPNPGRPYTASTYEFELGWLGTRIGRSST